MENHFIAIELYTHMYVNAVVYMVEVELDYSSQDFINLYHAK